MRIAIIGVRGVPSKWGGFDTFATELGPRLAEMGHKVTIFCQSTYTDDKYKKRYKNTTIKIIPTIRGKYTESIIYELLISVYTLFRSQYDVYYILGCRTTWVYLIHYILGRKLIFNSDGLEWRRKKWGKVARIYWKFSYWLARRISFRLISDSKDIKDYYKETYNINSTFLTYGANIYRNSDKYIKIVNEQYGLISENYLIVIARLEPENNIDIIISEHNASNIKEKLVIIGGVNYKSKYYEELIKLGNQRIVFLGPIYKTGHIEALLLNSKAYIHGHEVGGTNPILLQAMGCGSLIFANDNRFNRGVLRNCGYYWGKKQGELKKLMDTVFKSPVGKYSNIMSKGTDLITTYHSWETIADDYNNFFCWVIGEREDHKDSY